MLKKLVIASAVLGALTVAVVATVYAATIDGTAAPDDMCTGGLVGTDLADTMDGRESDDDMCGRDGEDTMNGNEGNDHMRGEDNEDILNGGIGNDFMSAGEGEDTLNGGGGNDRERGGIGDDTYVLPNSGNDVFIIVSGDIYENEEEVVNCGGGTDTVIFVDFPATTDILDNTDVPDPDTDGDYTFVSCEVRERLDLTFAPAPH